MSYVILRVDFAHNSVQLRLDGEEPTELVDCGMAIKTADVLLEILPHDAAAELIVNAVMFPVDTPKGQP